MLYTGFMLNSAIMRWKLKDYLDRVKVTPYAIAQQMGGNERSNQTMLYRIKDGERVTSTVPTIEQIIDALRKLTGTEVKFFDIIEETYE